MNGEDENTGPRRAGANCDDVTEAALGAERLISRVQDIVAEAVEPGKDQEAAFEEIIGEVDPAPEGKALRQALGMSETGSRELPKRSVLSHRPARED
jgi:hypothetical protein